MTQHSDRFPARRLVCFALCSFAAISVLSARSAAQSLTVLPAGFYATELSDNGGTVGGTATFSGQSRPCRWTSAGGVQHLGSIFGSFTYGDVLDVNPDGTAIVGLDRATSGSETAYRWVLGTGMQNLGYLPGTASSQAYGVSADGTVVVGTCGSPGVRAFRWTQNVGMAELQPLPGASEARAHAVSADGQLVAGSSKTTTGDRAVLWMGSSAPINLGLLSGGTYTSATAISADGQVVVGTGDSLGFTSAFRWTAAAGMVNIGTGASLAVNADGSVVVGSAASRAFIWRPDLGPGWIDLNPYLQNLGVNLNGSNLLSASGVSADGTVISGRGTLPGGASWRAVIPGCKANCDQSVSQPALTANDFACFLTSFAAGAPYANCDGSSTPPTLNANDFVCFITAFAAGCS
jgi:probable HAF family extracellular repeat protein